jgi:hypothetical protein
MIKVKWHQGALDELTRIWTLADSNQRKGITAATHALDQRLGSRPEEEGESRSEGRRITFFPPLSLLFRIEKDGRSVTVLHARLFLPRRHR